MAFRGIAPRQSLGRGKTQTRPLRYHVRVNVTYVSVGVAFKRYQKKVVSPNSNRDVAGAIKGREAETSRHQESFSLSLSLAPSDLLLVPPFFFSLSLFLGRLYHLSADSTGT